MMPTFVKKFDLRGKWNDEINEIDGYYIALSLFKYFTPKKVLVGWDTRPISKLLAMKLIQGLTDKSVEVEYIEHAPIEYITSAACVLDYDLNIMVTGSHNAYDWTGLLMHLKGGKSFDEEIMNNIFSNYENIKNQQYSNISFNIDELVNAEEKVKEVYVNKIKELIPLDKIKRNKIAIDIGDGSGYKLIEILKSLLPEPEIKEINNRKLYDINSSHTADPSEEKNMKDLVDVMKEEKFGIGFAFDSDADRVLAVDAKGQILNGSVLGGVIGYSLNKYLNLSDKCIGYAVECGPSIYNNLTSGNITLKPVAVGRSIIRNMERENAIDLGVENVGHFYYKDFFMTDSSLFSILLILLWLTDGNTNEILLQKFPDGKRVQGFVSLDSSFAKNKNEFIDSIKNEFKNIKEVTVDGERIEIMKEGVMVGWVCLRNSGYEKKLKYYYGAIDDNVFSSIQNIITKYLN